MRIRYRSLLVLFLFSLFTLQARASKSLALFRDSLNENSLIAPRPSDIDRLQLSDVERAVHELSGGLSLVHIMSHNIRRNISSLRDYLEMTQEDLLRITLAENGVFVSDSVATHILKNTFSSERQNSSFITRCFLKCFSCFK